MPNFLLLGKQYEAYVRVIVGQAGGPLIYIDHAGHLHVVPTTPDSRRIVDLVEPELKQLQVHLARIAEKVHEATGAAAPA